MGVTGGASCVRAWWSQSQNSHYGINVRDSFLPVNY